MLYGIPSKFRVSRLCNISLITFTKVLKIIEGFVWTIWNCLESVLILWKKFRGMFRVFQIVSFKVERRSDVPQIDRE